RIDHIPRGKRWAGIGIGELKRVHQAAKKLRNSFYGGITADDEDMLIPRAKTRKVWKFSGGVPTRIRRSTTNPVADVVTNSVKAGQQCALRVLCTKQIETGFEQPSKKLRPAQVQLVDYGMVDVTLRQIGRR